MTFDISLIVVLHLLADLIYPRKEARMFEDRLTERKTSVGVIALGDIALVTDKDTQTHIVHFTAMYEGTKKNYVGFETFSPTLRTIGSKKMSWTEFEETIVKSNILGKLEVSKHHWQVFVEQYKNYLLIQKGEYMQKFHTAFIQSLK